MTALPLPESFALTLRGYDREQELRLLTLDRDTAHSQAELLADRLTQARAEISALRGQLDRLCRAPADSAAVGGKVSRLLAPARSEADDIIPATQHRAAAEDVVRRTHAQLCAIDAAPVDAESVLEEGATLQVAV